MAKEAVQPRGPIPPGEAPPPGAQPPLPPPPAVVPRVFWIAVLLSAALVGFLVGASKSPLADAVVPVFAALLTATVTIFITAKPGTLLGSDGYATIGLGYLLLVVGFVPGLLVGSVVRAGAAEYVSVGPFVIDWGDQDPFAKLLTAEEEQLYFVIDANLKALGVPLGHRRAHLAGVVEDERAADPDGSAKASLDWLATNTGSAFSDSVSRLAACNRDSNESASAAMTATATAVLSLSAYLSATPPSSKPNSQCSFSCNVDLLTASVTHWATDTNLAKVASCGLTDDDAFKLRAAIETIKRLSPMAMAATELQQRGASFRTTWDAVAGEFTEGTVAETPAIAAIEQGGSAKP